MCIIKTMKTRHNLFFDTDQWVALIKLAKKTGLSVAEHIRRAVKDYLDRL